MKKIRILNIVGRMARGGVETWLLEMVRHLDPSRYTMDFLLHDKRQGDYDAELRALGSNLLYAEHPHNPLRYAWEFQKALSSNRYDVVHSHVYTFSGVTLPLAMSAKVPARIAHSHTTRSAADESSSLRRLYFRSMQASIRLSATHQVAISRGAARSLFGRSWETDPRAQVLYYGFDFSRFLTAPAVGAAKALLRIPSTRFVVGHVGRFDPVKNHSRLVDIFEELVRGGADAHLLLVGDGPLREEVSSALRRRGLAHLATLAGTQANVVPYLAAMDVFVFPSEYEGLGIVALEAQAVGTPLVCSDRVPREVDVAEGRVVHLSLDSSTAEWARAARQLGSEPRTGAAEGVARMNASRFGLETCVSSLARIYDSTSRSAPND